MQMPSFLDLYRRVKQLRRHAHSVLHFPRKQELSVSTCNNYVVISGGTQQGNGQIRKFRGFIGCYRLIYIFLRANTMSFSRAVTKVSGPTSLGMVVRVGLR